MKNSHRFNRAITTAILWLPVFLMMTGCESTPKPSAKAAVAPAAASVTKLGGGARLSYDGHTWQPLRIGMGINAGCVIQTALKSFVEIVVEELDKGKTGSKDEAETIPLRNRIVLEADSIARIRTLPQPGIYSGESEIGVTLDSGKVMCASVASAGSPVVEVRVGNAVVRGRSAIFLVQSDGIVQVARGAVAVTAADLITGRAVSEGFQLNIKTSQLSKSSADTGAAIPAAKPAPAPLPRIEPGPPRRKY